ncbi:hypothetical protein C7271_00895 [filamentous cyanobacterium CCP5]|nr:hypothetical protein C7271_00895 [filamentous cyanobacterium CCP5]
MTSRANHDWEALEARIAANEEAIAEMRHDFSARCSELEGLVKLYQSRIEQLNQPDSSQAQPIKDDRDNEKEALAQMGNHMIQLVQELLKRIEGIERRLDKGTGSNGNGQR